MSISGIQATSTYDLLMNLAGSTKSRPATPASTDSTAYSARNSRNSDKVSISKDAWAMLLAEHEKNKPADVPAAELSEEEKAWAEPDWLSGYFFTLTPLSPLGSSIGDDLLDQAGAVPSHISSEYTKHINECWQAIVKENGLSELSVDERYNAVVVDKESSEALRQQMAERVKNDPVLVDITQRFGKVIARHMSVPLSS
ncbi:hypothetical protein AGMMS49960_08550 [Betaproteobacteria bacterium]|nr:hypothetical protein AGMMS49960_08550 [Betaproteobacteria bacterium]GHU06941.1 hypothetical protein AGMMS50225_03100 [Betaproteobacteria bacterium]GHU18274.1 hypothetical protein AGMMS50243_08020 [Betaproteobacteria bacterium]